MYTKSITSKAQGSITDYLDQTESSNATKIIYLAAEREQMAKEEVNQSSKRTQT